MDSTGGVAKAMLGEEAKEEEQHVVASFEALELDPRLTKALQRTNIVQPTLIQAKAIPLALAGKDILAKARTGSGKTLAYLLPILHQLLAKTSTGSQLVCRGLILVPTKELARQVCSTIEDLLHYGPRTNLQPTNLATEESLTLQQGHLATHPTIIVSTPARLLPHLEAGNLRLLPGTLDFLVIDEADLVLSFGYANDMQKLISTFLPKTPQTFLMSATLTAEVEQLKTLVLRSPVILRLTEGEEDKDGEEDGTPASKRLQQYTLHVPSDEDKFLLMYVILKLKLLKGKLLIFANDVERCFRLRLFLEQFGVKTCLLNPELPLVSRHHIVDQFNRGAYDIIIASDQQPAEAVTTTSNGKDRLKRGKGKKGKSSSKEAGVARGVDFCRVDVVINFDLPLHADSYVHRVGRTARGTASGTAISFVLMDGEGGKEGSSSSSRMTSTTGMKKGGERRSPEDAVLHAIIADQEARGHSLEPYAFDLRQLDGFRYRCGDALRSVTPASIRAARLQAIKEEISRCERLKGFWEERPKDLALLRHDTNLGVIRARPHLKHVPEYLMEQTFGEETSISNCTNSVSSQKLAPLPQVVSQTTRTPAFRRTKRRGPPQKGRGNLLKRVKK